MKQSPPVPPATCAQIGEVWRRLAANYGEPRLNPSGDAVGELVGTILSQHTTDVSSAKAYEDLRARFPTWASVESAPVDEVASAIRFAGLPQQKARTIQAALRELDPETLATLPSQSVAGARATLTAVRGIGDKTASCVLLFALGMPAQPVDTHIERVSKRLGIAGGAKNASGIQHILESCLPADAQTMFAFHVDLIRHGRQVCLARAPKCSMCVLSDICEFYASTRSMAVS